MDQMYPASAAIHQWGNESVPAVITILADGKLARDSTNYRPPWYDHLTPEERVQFPYKPESDVLRWVASVATKQTPLNGQASIVNEYEQKAVRLRLLRGYQGEDKEGEATQQAKVSVEVPTLFASNKEERVAQVLELHYVLTDQLAPSTEAQVLTTIVEAEKLKAYELAPDLCDKLDPAPPAKVENVLAANSKGRFSPAIAQASKAALRSMGHDALPALLDAISMTGRGPQFRQKAMSLIVAAAGDDARTVLERAAKQNDERAARLRAIIERYNKPQ